MNSITLRKRNLLMNGRVRILRAGRLSGHWQKGRVGVMFGVVGIYERAGVWDGKGRKKGGGSAHFLPCIAVC